MMLMFAACTCLLFHYATADMKKIYEIDYSIPNNSARYEVGWLKTLENEETELIVEGYRVTYFCDPITKDYFKELIKYKADKQGYRVLFRSYKKVEQSPKLEKEPEVMEIGPRLSSKLLKILVKGDVAQRTSNHILQREQICDKC